MHDTATMIDSDSDSDSDSGTGVSHGKECKFVRVQIQSSCSGNTTKVHNIGYFGLVIRTLISSRC